MEDRVDLLCIFSKKLNEWLEVTGRRVFAQYKQVLDNNYICPRLNLKGHT